MFSCYGYFMSKSIVKKKSYDFALRIIALSQYLRNENHFEMSRQLIKAGTSIGANVEEALAGQSKRDFVAKMAIASKEARETNYWLRLVRDAKIVDAKKCKSLIGESEELVKILTSIVKTGQNKLKTKN